MKIKNLIKAIPAAIILLIFSQSAWSQVAVERSKDKMVIAGVPYYIHQVKKGETAYSISKAYGITVEDLTKENPPAVYGLNEGQTLRIPVKPVSESAVSQPNGTKTNHDESKFIYHNLKPGETIYFLSKTYDVSENDIIRSNPGIDITKLSVGMEIAVPRKDFMTSRQQFDEPVRPQANVEVKEEKQLPMQRQEQQQQQEEGTGFIYHKVKSGESLSSIADQYGLSVRVLRKANRDVRFPQVGDSLKVPGAMNQTKSVEVPVAVEVVPAVEEIPFKQAERPAGFTPVTNLSGSMDVAVLLPFYLKENSSRSEADSSKAVKGKKTVKVTRRNDDWIYPGSLDFIEMYQGVLLAADTLRSLGMSINLHTYDIKGDTVEIMKLIKARKLEGMDLIIGPVYSHNLSLVAAYAKDLGIPVVSPVPLFDNTILSGNPDLFLASSSLEVAQQALVETLGGYPDNNFIFIHSDTLGTDEDVNRFKKLIISELSSRMPYEDIRFRELLFYSRSMFDNDSINRLSHALSDRSENIVIIASEDLPVISETMIDLHSLSRRFDIKVFGYPAMRDIDNLDPKYFFALDLMLYSPYWVDYTRSDIKQFNADFRQKFLTEPNEKSYAWQGYDIAYYFMSGLAIYGKEFVSHPEMHHPDLLQTDYDFKCKSAGDGFENKNLFLIRYTKDYEIKLVDDAGTLLQK
ncbi:MAG: LysM peptidoglycan-binding domain-containing protein [Bacteroidales bacterium]|nr:LysM peptidoglycan-binding domain-containing protein [Bacteroidales bacterium]